MTDSYFLHKIFGLLTIYDTLFIEIFGTYKTNIFNEEINYNKKTHVENMCPLPRAYLKVTQKRSIILRKYRSYTEYKSIVMGSFFCCKT